MKKDIKNYLLPSLEWETLTFIGGVIPTAYYAYWYLVPNTLKVRLTVSHEAKEDEFTIFLDPQSDFGFEFRNMELNHVELDQVGDYTLELIQEFFNEFTSKIQGRIQEL